MKRACCTYAKNVFVQQALLHHLIHRLKGMQQDSLPKKITNPIMTATIGSKSGSMHTDHYFNMCLQ